MLKWRFNPFSISYWQNFILHYWDQYLDTEVRLQLKLQNAVSDEMIFFKKKGTSNSQQRYFEFSNLVDACVLDIESLAYGDKSLILSILYLLSGMYMKIFTFKQVKKNLTMSQALILEESPYNQIFQKFIAYFSLQLSHLAQATLFVAKVLAISQYPNSLIDNLIANNKKIVSNSMRQILLRLLPSLTKSIRIRRPRGEL